ncbi:MAG: hypothetical protein WA795_14480 [Candidatus Sulfotelmatobacter sp.]
MPRPLLSAAFVLLLAGVPVSAQHGGGGHASGGGHAGFASHGGGFSGHSSAPAFGGARAGSGFAARSFAPRSASRPAFSSRSFNRSFNRGFNRSRGARFGAYGVGSNCYYYGYGCMGAYGYPWGYAGEIDPYWWWDSDSGSSYDPDQQYQTGLANEMNQQSLDEQRMRKQGDQDAYAQWAPSPPRQHSEHEELNEAAPATVLVFRDEHKQEVKNYAIVGQMLWVFDLQHTQKIPLSDIDLPATTKANDARGVDFQLPGAHEGQ